MCSADGIECLLTRLEASIQINLAYLLYISRAKAGRPRGIVQMVGIVQTEAAARLFQLLGREAFERGLSSDWHEQGQLDGAMREMQCCRAGFRGLGGKKNQNHGIYLLPPVCPRRAKTAYRASRQQIELQRG